MDLSDPNNNNNNQNTTVNNNNNINNNNVDDDIDEKQMKNNQSSPPVVVAQIINNQNQDIVPVAVIVSSTGNTQTTTTTTNTNNNGAPPSFNIPSRNLNTNTSLSSSPPINTATTIKKPKTPCYELCCCYWATNELTKECTETFPCISGAFSTIFFFPWLGIALSSFFLDLSTCNCIWCPQNMQQEAKNQLQPEDQENYMGFFCAYCGFGYCRRILTPFCM
jgi:hypothetical protein